MSRLRNVLKNKIASCKNLGSLLNSEQALQLIQSSFQEINIEDIYNFSNNNDAIYGYISNDGFIAAELYCFKNDSGFTGVLVANAFIVHMNNEISLKGSMDCKIINESPLNIYDIVSKLLNENHDLCGYNCSFSNEINSFELLKDMLPSQELI